MYIRKKTEFDESSWPQDSDRDIVLTIFW